METLVIIVIAIAVLLVQISLIVAIFTIKNNSNRQTKLITEQNEIMEKMKSCMYLTVKKDISEITVKYSQGVKTVTVNDWLKAYSQETNNVETVK